MKKIYYPLMALALVATGCSNKKAESTQSIGIRMENMDTTAKVGTDFYQYATGGWQKLNPLTDEYSRFGSFDLLAENNREQLKGLIEGIASQENETGTVAQKIGDLYNIAMDVERLNQDGVAPIKADLDRINAITDRGEIAALMGEMNYVDMFFAMYVDADMMDSKKNLLQTIQSGLGMGERDYYLDETETMQNIRAEYRKHIAAMFTLAGFTEEQSTAAVEAVMSIETRLATAHYTQVLLRDSEKNYHKMTIDELKADFTGFNWDAYFAGCQAQAANEISVSQPEPIKEAIAIINDADLDAVKYYLSWKLINGSASYLSEAVEAQNFAFYGKVISGKQEQSPRWKRAVSTVDGSLGEAVGQMYVKKYFSEDAKHRMETLVKNLLTAFGQRVDNLEWMSDETKAKAHEKLSTFYVKVGYPNQWRDYSPLVIDNKLSYWDNMKAVNAFNTAIMMEKLSKPVDKEEWLMTPQTVNAYYNPTTNEICFPAGILQYPFFDMEADDAFNYGAIGVVIAHEVTHGFDDQGCNFDKDGNFNNWWTAEDKARFDERTAVMKDYFDNIVVNEDGLHANGAFTLGENIADHGGLQVAFHALKNAMAEQPLETVNELTPEQRFFIAYAGVWAGNVRPEEIIRRTKTDPHSLGKWRVDGALPHINAWYEAFGIAETDPLYLAPENRVSIW